MRFAPSGWLRRLVFVPVLALGLLPFPSSAADAPFEIPVIVPLTGPAAFVGEQTGKAFVAMEAIINRQGGIKGRPIKFVISDDQTNPQLAVQLLSQQLAKKPPLVIAGLAAALCNASAGLLKEDGPVLWCLSAAVHPPAGSWIYSVSFSTADQSPAMLRYMKLRGWNKVALIATTDASGQTLESDLVNYAALPEFRGMSIVAREHLGITDITADAQMSRIKASGADVVVPLTIGTPLGTLLRSSRDAGITLPYIVSAGNLVYKQMEAYKSLISGKDFYVMGIPAVDSSTVQDRTVVRAIAEYTQAMTAAGIRPDTGAAIVWDTAKLIIEAYKRVGTTATPAQLRDAINGISNYSGIYGKFDFKASPQRGIVPFWTVMDRWDGETDRFIAVTKPGDLVAK